MQPLAHKLRPKDFSDVFGQDHLVGIDGVLTKMIEKNKYMSFILYGPPGCGKTTIAMLFSERSKMDSYIFNASTDNKAKLKDILDTTSYNNVLILIDEIHRMKSDIQDYLLPYIENGKATIIGLTTVNPYQSINMAIRSRCHLYQVYRLDDDDIKKAINRGIRELDIDVTILPDAIDLIVQFSNHEIRTALNILDSTALILNDGDTITKAIIKKVSGKPQRDLDDHEDNYYAILSALQKSIRGSDVDASLHYLARLLTLGDLQIIIRRLLVIAYEDIGLANPTMGQKVLTACDVALKVGFPEARIPLSTVVIDMAISPKSNTALTAIDEAIDDYEKNDTGIIPDHANNKMIRVKPEIYHYPHNDKNSLNSQRYIADKLLNRKYYIPKDESSYEKALSERLKLIYKTKNIK